MLHALTVKLLTLVTYILKCVRTLRGKYGKQHFDRYVNVVTKMKDVVSNKYKYKYNSYSYCAPYSLTDGALQKSANTCFTAVAIARCC